MPDLAHSFISHSVYFFLWAHLTLAIFSALWLMLPFHHCFQDCPALPWGPLWASGHPHWLVFLTPSPTPWTEHRFFYLSLPCFSLRSPTGKELVTSGTSNWIFSGSPPIFLSTTGLLGLRQNLSPLSQREGTKRITKTFPALQGP